MKAHDAARAAMAQTEELPCVYKATTKKGETAHFGEYSAAKAWAGWGTVEQVPLKTLTLIEKPAKPCDTCKALARTVMLDQTSHDTQRQWVGLTDDEIRDVIAEVSQIPPIDFTTTTYGRAIEAKLKEKNT